ncbi:hypothetical protein QYF36_015932 [Acer negundo]|nr:hypothetical protein QYF36_015932 [Acer negundo]
MATFNMFAKLDLDKRGRKVAEKVSAKSCFSTSTDDTTRVVLELGDQLFIAHRSYSLDGPKNIYGKGSSEDNYFGPSEDDRFGSRNDRKEGKWTLQDGSYRQVVVKERSCSCEKALNDQNSDTVSLVLKTNMGERCVDKQEYDLEGLIEVTNSGEVSLAEDTSLMKGQQIQMMSEEIGFDK